MTEEDRKKILMSFCVAYPEDMLLDFMRDYSEELLGIMSYVFNQLKGVKKIDPKREDYHASYDTIKMASDFLGTIDNKYKEEFDKMIVDGTFDFEMREEGQGNKSRIKRRFSEDGDLLGYDIVISSDDTIEDVFSLVHEYFHSTNTKERLSFDSVLLTESVSIFYELLLFDYLKEKNISINDIEKQMQNRLYNLSDDAYDILDKVNLLVEGLKDPNIINDLEIMDEEKLEYYYEKSEASIKYGVSTLIATLMYYDYHRGMIKLDNVENYNDSLKGKNNDLLGLRYLFLSIPSSDYIKDALDYYKEQINYEDKNKTR